MPVDESDEVPIRRTRLGQRHFGDRAVQRRSTFDQDARYLATLPWLIDVICLAYLGEQHQ